MIIRQTSSLIHCQMLLSSGLVGLELEEPMIGIGLMGHPGTLKVGGLLNIPKLTTQISIMLSSKEDSGEMIKVKRHIPLCVKTKIQLHQKQLAHLIHVKQGGSFPDIVENVTSNCQQNLLGMLQKRHVSLQQKTQPQLLCPFLTRRQMTSSKQ